MQMCGEMPLYTNSSKLVFPVWVCFVSLSVCLPPVVCLFWSVLPGVSLRCLCCGRKRAN
jgi:hypothetical protein